MKIWSTLIVLLLVFGTIDAAKIVIRQMDNGRRITLDVDLNDTIAAVKAKIVEYERLPQEYEPVLIWDNELDDDKTLADYKIKDEGTLWLKIRVRGWKPTTN